MSTWQMSGVSTNPPGVLTQEFNIAQQFNHAKLLLANDNPRLDAFQTLPPIENRGDAIIIGAYMQIGAFEEV